MTNVSTSRLKLRIIIGLAAISAVVAIAALPLAATLSIEPQPLGVAWKGLPAFILFLLVVAVSARAAWGQGDVAEVVGAAIVIVAATAIFTGLLGDAGYGSMLAHSAGVFTRDGHPIGSMDYFRISGVRLQADAAAVGDMFLLVALSIWSEANPGRKIPSPRSFGQHPLALRVCVFSALILAAAIGVATGTGEGYVVAFFAVFFSIVPLVGIVILKGRS